MISEVDWLQRLVVLDVLKVHGVCLPLMFTLEVPLCLPLILRFWKKLWLEPLVTY